MVSWRWHVSYASGERWILVRDRMLIGTVEKRD